MSSRNTYLSPSDRETALALSRALRAGAEAALANGDLAALKLHTCGKLAEYYGQFSEEEFKAVHDSVDQDTFPTIARVDRIEIDGDTAIAEVTAHTRAAPTENTVRTINLQKFPDGWKVCYPQN